ncbi:N-terminal kinase-like protein isoform X8 [Calonectris borealis]|uniref:N-terminal kinase-like protein isoform X8 n=1 Tax=Calonectris borealis TaxID=1323832 RepID=UPI003F4B9E2F
MWLFSRDPVRDFPFELGPPDTDPDLDPDPDPAPAADAAPAPLWRLLRGRRKADGAPVSVFAHSLGTGDAAATPLARAALRRLRSLRHPSVLGYLDSLETEQCLYLVTEAVTPLRRHLRLRPPTGDLGEQEVAWGLHQLLTALSFLGGSGLVHHALGLDAVFVDPGGDWKLGGLERVAAASEGVPPRPPGVPPQPQDPPELSDSSRGQGEPWAGDMWRLGCLIWEVFNGPLPRPGALRSFGKLPAGLVPPFCELVAAEPSARPGPGQLLQRLQRPGAFLACPLVHTGLFLEQFQVRDPSERRAFLQELGARLEALPGPFRRHKLLPRLLAALRFGSADASALPPLLKVAKALDPPEYQERIVPVIVRLFSSPERALRLQLLQQLEEYVEFLPEATVEAQIFPHVAHGFLDTNPAIREQTVKECAGRVLPALCGLTADPHPGVRQQAFRAIRSFLDQLEAAAESGGALEGEPPSAAAAPGGPGGGSGGLGAAVSWAVTGVTSLTARLMGAEAGAPPQTPPQAPAEGPLAPPKEPPPEEPPLEDPDGWDDDWGSLEDMELPRSPPVSNEEEEGAPPQSPGPPLPDPPPTAPPPARGEEEGEGEWGVGGEWGTEDAWEALPSQQGPAPGSGRRQREQQRRRELEAKRRGGPRGPPKPGPPKLGTRKLD